MAPAGINQPIAGVPPAGWRRPQGWRLVGLQLAAILICVAVALLFDALDDARAFNVGTTGLLDEPAHLALTALLLLGLAPWIALPRAFVIGALVASVAIDLDHVPVYLGASHLSAQPGGRPYTHSFVTVCAALAVALAVRRWRAAALGAAVGLTSHLVRDICEGPPGVSLFWPASGHEFLGTQADFRILVVALTCLALLGLVRTARSAV